jgi:large subunit ribosomal protein L24
MLYHKWKLKKGDEVIVLVGRSKGKIGAIEQVDRKHDQVLIAGVNLYKKHIKADVNQEGGIVEKAMPIHVSNVALLDPKTKKPTRIGFSVVDGKKVRVTKSSGTVLA